MRETMLVLNFDHIASRAVARTLRAEKVRCKILPGNTSAQEIFALSPHGLIFAGAPGEKNEFDYGILEGSTPVLALGGMACAVVEALGGTCGEIEIEHELSSVHIGACPIFQQMENSERMLRHVRHWELPPILRPVAQAQGIELGFAHVVRPFYGLQFNLEQNAPEDSQLLRNFAVDICGCTDEWNEETFIQETKDDLTELAGSKGALCCVTGGLDSALSAKLAQQALGDHLKCVFIDTGFLRRGEAEHFLECCKTELHLDVKYIDAKERYLKALAGCESTAVKKDLFRRVTREILEEQAAEMGPFDCFIKGTNCTDRLFSDGKTSVDPENLIVYEPLRELFKDEIKQVAAVMGLPKEMIERQPFPGGGLALRIVGEVTQQRLEILREADAVFTGEMRQAGAVKRLYQYFASLIPDKGEGEGCTVVLKAVQISDTPISMAARLPYDVMENVVYRILKTIPQVAHVVYDMTPGKVYSNAEW